MRATLNKLENFPGRASRNGRSAGANLFKATPGHMGFKLKNFNKTFYVKLTNNFSAFTWPFNMF